MDRKKDPSSGGSIKGKLILIMLLICGVPILIISIINYRNTINDGRKHAEELGGKQALVIKDEVMSIVGQNLRAIESAAANPFTREFLKDPDKSMDEMVRYLSLIDASMGDDNSTAVAGVDGFQLARSRGDCIDISGRDYFREAMGGVHYTSDVIVSESSKTRVIVTAVPVYSEDGTVIGIVQRIVNLEGLGDYLSSAVSGTNKAFIVDSAGTMIAHSHESIPVGTPADRSTEEFFVRSQSSDSGTVIDESDGSKLILSYVKEASTGWVMAVTEDYSVVMAPAYKEAVAILIISILIFVIVAVISVILSKSFTDPIMAISEKLNMLAEGRFSDVEKYTDRKDEFGMMARSTNTLIGKLREIVGSIKRSSSNVNVSVNALADSSHLVENSAGSVNESVRGIARGAEEQADKTQSESGSISNMSEAVGILMEEAQGLSDSVKVMNDSSKTSAEYLEKLGTSSEGVSEDVEKITGQINATSRAVDAINGKVDLINDIAARTNLLSLNASIEAARAGEAGRGFAVVAEEIGKLAAQSSDSADEIRLEMKRLLEASQSAVQQSQEVQESIRQQQEVITLTVQNINDLLNEIDDTVGKVDNINRQAAACSDAKDEIISTMESLADICEQNAASTQNTSSAMEELDSTVGDLADSASALQKSADDLKQNISFFE